MLYSLLSVMNNLDDKVKKIMNIGLKFSFWIAISSFVVLLFYNVIYSVPNIYYIGIKLFNLSISFSTSFFICAILIDSLKKANI